MPLCPAYTPLTPSPPPFHVRPQMSEAVESVAAEFRREGFLCELGAMPAVLPEMPRLYNRAPAAAAGAGSGAASQVRNEYFAPRAVRRGRGTWPARRCL